MEKCLLKVPFFQVIGREMSTVYHKYISTFEYINDTVTLP